MALLNRMATMLRSNLNDMTSRGEDPEKLFKQLLLDMQDEIGSVREKLARALSDEHLLTAKHDEARGAAESWRGKAMLAVQQGDDALARAAVDRSLTQERSAAAYARQGGEQQVAVTALREHYARLQARLEQTGAEGELLLIQLRRSRDAGVSTDGVLQAEVNRKVKDLRDQTQRAQANFIAGHQLAHEDAVETRLLQMGREQDVDRMLAELKQHKQLPQDGSGERAASPSRVLGTGE